ncbi:hypothetical protein [Pseudaeromonas paramecii]|uniref:Uncharacterized protein n=1 Tax=Pseudaeromonas paramecii TaxID=2138166 RepID=A0ABP8PXP2_9GAMM
MNSYKVTNPAVIAIYEQMMDQVRALKAEALAFAEKFDAKPCYCNEVSQFRFSGLILTEYHQRADAVLWTYPARCGGTSWPRRSLKKRPAWSQEDFAAKKAELAELQRAYEEAWPVIDKVDRDPLWDAIGTSWGELAFSGISLFFVDGELYLSTRLELKNCTEILGSEYTAAEKRMMEKAA